MADDDVPDGLKKIVDAFQRVMSAALTGISSTPSDELGAIMPDEFVQKYCQPLLTVWGIQVSDSEIWKKSILKFYSLQERKVEFLKIIRMDEITTDSVVQMHLDVMDEKYEYTIDLVFVIDHAGKVTMIDIRIDNVTPRVEEAGEAMMAQTGGVVKYGEAVSGISLESVVFEFLKKMLGL